MSEENLKFLIDLQQIDRRLVQLEREARSIPEKKESLTERLRSLENGVQDAKDRHQHTLSSIKQLELEVEAAKDKVRRYKHQQFEIRNNEAYRALEDEIREMNRGIRGFEDKELELMEQAEQLKGLIAERQAALEEESKHVSADQADMDTRLNRVLGDLEAMRGQREAMASKVEEEWLRRYDLILKNKGDVALVKVDGGGVCSGCHMKVPPHQVVEARNPLTMTFCSYCGRMLYFEA